jgi:hypothetical protein
MKDELAFLNKISENHYAVGITSMDCTDGIIKGRPYGGMGILWKKSIGPNCTIINYSNESRLMGLEYKTGSHKVLFINVYMPCCSDENLPDFQYYLSKINDIIESYDSPHVVVIGDFNADTLSNQKFGNELSAFCDEEGLILSDLAHITDHFNSFTFLSNHGTKSWLDHFMATNGGHSLINKMYIDYNIISSDHQPIVAEFTIPAERTLLDNAVDNTSKLNWEVATQDDIEQYHRNTDKALSNIYLDHNLILCDDVRCKNESHINAINHMYSSTVSALVESANFLMKKPNQKNKQVPGWNEYVKEVHELARDSFLFWRANGSPRHGECYHQMRITRANFKLAIRQCKKDKTRHIADSLAKNLLNKDKLFWKQIKQIQGNSSPPSAATIDGVSGNEAVCEMWQEHYYKLLNSTKDYSKKNDVLCSLRNLQSSDTVNRITATEIEEAIKMLRKGKACGHDGISSEHLIYCNNKIYPLLSILFNAMLVHSYLPEEFMFTLIIPLLKDKKGDITSKDNYRPIAITTMFSKVFELLLLARYDDRLHTADNQFGYKKGLGTDTCIFTFKEIVNYYRSLSSNVYICFMDASKAFDRINHWYLFDKLLNRGIPKLIVRILLVWYTTQSFSVKWCNVVSRSFHVTNGVRQGGILSPRLFNVFIDQLSNELIKAGIGCKLNNQCFNHLQYADDSVILAPSPTALQKLINICDKFAKQYDMLYNEKKTFCMCIKHKSNILIDTPNIILNGNSLQWLKNHQYLGVFINEYFNDDTDIKRQMKYIYAKGNMLIRKFRHCSMDVKVQLFKTYLSNLYCSQLWCLHTQGAFKRLTVSYNNIFRYLCNIKGRHSISNIFTNLRLDNFGAIYRKSIFSLLSRLMECDNILVQTIYNSMYFIYYSNLHKKWQNALYSCK